MSALRFAPYQSHNYQDYIRIYHPYWLDTNRLETDQNYSNHMRESGFLVGDPNQTSSKIMRKSPFHLCALLNEQVVGIIRADYIDTLDHITAIEWGGNNRLQELFQRGRGLELGVIMVDENFKNQGIASALLNQLEAYMRQVGFNCLFSWVPIHPENKASLGFHSHQSFEPIAHFHQDGAFGIKQYASVLLGKSA